MPRKTVQNKITSPEKLRQINPNNLRLKKDFLLYLKSVQRSPGTIAGYDSDLTIIFTLILDELGNKDFNKLTKRDVIFIQNWMVEAGLSSARIRRLKAAMSSLSNFIESLLDEEPEYAGFRPIIRKIENPPLNAVREKTVWSDEDLEQLLDQLTEKGKIEEACFVALGMYGGRRKAELCRFKVSDFADDHVVCDGALYKSAPILTKGDKMLECYTLKKRFDPYLRRWMELREEEGVESEWLFPMAGKPAEHMPISTANSWANVCSRLSGKDFYFHSLRHYFVSALIKAGIPDGVVVEIVGWSSQEMVKIYNDNPKDDRISMFFKDGEIDTSAARTIDTI